MLMPYKVHPPPPSARIILLTSLPLSFYLPPPKMGHLLSHNTLSIGSLHMMSMEEEAQNCIPCYPSGTHHCAAQWLWWGGDSWAPIGQHQAGGSQKPVLSLLQQTMSLQCSRTSKCFHRPHAAHSHQHNERSWTLPQIAMYCICIMDPVQKLWGSLNFFLPFWKISIEVTQPLWEIWNKNQYLSHS